jgi:hypothetical protein
MAISIMRMIWCPFRHFDEIISFQYFVLGFRGNRSQSMAFTWYTRFIIFLKSYHIHLAKNRSSFSCYLVFLFLWLLKIIILLWWQLLTPSLWNFLTNGLFFFCLVQLSLWCTHHAMVFSFNIQCPNDTVVCFWRSSDRGLRRSDCSDP